MSDQETLNVYASKAEDYAAMTDNVSADDPCLKAFIAAIPTGGHVLDLGCGPGASAAVMSKAGLSVVAYDPVPEMIALARQHEGVTTKIASFDDVNEVDVYDGIWANFSLLHAPRKDMPTHLSRIAIALKPGGRFHVAVKTGTGSQRDGLGRCYTYYLEAELTNLLRDAGLNVVARREGRDKGLSGDVSAWIALAAHA